ncbi:MAG: S-adenosylmethionine:tRNA ribosyltransferase-isomerase [Candidatus Binatia bacterium]|nr:MAG: S-adenosylmethionine:tRNA ribosyltransferase-isomerase [Candidatus Binatia bacterium]
MRRSDYEFELPPELIAQYPAAERDQARLMVLDRTTRQRIHARVADLPSFLAPGDLVIVNDTRVIPARITTTGPTGGKVELLFVRRISTLPSSTPAWTCLGRPGRYLKPGQRLGLPEGVEIEVIERQGAGRYLVRWLGAVDEFAFLQRHGRVPLPPYIRRPQGPSPEDEERYQTVFARVPGSVAAPTAGLHFTPALLEKLEARGVQTSRLTLHVGPGTFQPIRGDDVRLHRMEPEWCDIPAATVEAIRAAKMRGNRVVAVGTTTTRALESAATFDDQVVLAGARWADRFILPGYRFGVVDSLLTNFHLPGSTLVLLVAALVGREWLLESYAEAIQRRYRFYSYGDAMLIL